MGKRKSSKSSENESPKNPLNWTNVITAVITLIGTFITAYFGYLQFRNGNEDGDKPVPTAISTISPTTTTTPTPTSPESPCPQDMTAVREGEFILGSAEGDPNATSNEMPSRRIYLDTYCIGKTEVSNSMYAIFISETHPGDNHPINDLPVVDITWYQADEYCRWKGIKENLTIKLPSEYQWEKAARGEGGRIYPWGNTWDDNKANSGSGKTGLVSVFAYSDVESPYEGLLNMAGNASEWVDDWYEKRVYETLYDGIHNPLSPPELGINPTKVVRGGYFGASSVLSRSSARNGAILPNLSFDFIGFRCATEYFPP